MLKPLNLIILVRKQYTAPAHGTDAIVEAHVQASELANAAQLSSGGTYGVMPQSENENGGNSGAKHACCQQLQATMDLHHQGLPGTGMRMTVATFQLWVSKRGSYNAAKVWGECIIMALLGGEYVHDNVCKLYSSRSLLNSQWYIITVHCGICGLHYKGATWTIEAEVDIGRCNMESMISNAKGDRKMYKRYSE